MLDYQKQLDHLKEVLEKFDIEVGKKTKVSKSKEKLNKSLTETHLFSCFGLKSTKGTRELIEAIWNEEGICTDRTIINTVERIKQFLNLKQEEKEQVKISAIEDMQNFSLSHKQDFDIFEYGNDGNFYLRMVFRLKDNRKLINHFQSKGWQKTKMHRNSDGDPTHWGAEMWVRNCNDGMFLVNMLYPIENMD